MIPRLIATFGLVGRIPVAAGTCASLAALATGYLLHWLGGFPLLLGAAAVLGGLGFWATRVEDGLDQSEIVVDEVVGQWVALMPLSAGLWHRRGPGACLPLAGMGLGLPASSASSTSGSRGRWPGRIGARGRPG